MRDLSFNARTGSARTVLGLFLCLGAFGCAQRDLRVRWFPPNHEFLVQEARQAEEEVESVGGPFIRHLEEAAGVRADFAPAPAEPGTSATPCPVEGPPGPSGSGMQPCIARAPKAIADAEPQGSRF